MHTDAIARQSDRLPPLKLSVFSLGKVQPTSYNRSIKTPMAYSLSRIMSLYVKENDFVKQGDPLFSVEDSDEALFSANAYRKEMTSKQEQIKSAEAKVRSSRIIRDYQQIEYDRFRYLASNDAAPLQQAQQKLVLLQAAQQELDASIAALNSAKSTFDAARSQYQAADAKSTMTTIVSPIDASVYKIYSRVGETLERNLPVILIGDSRSMGVLAEVHAADIDKVRIGETAKVTSNDLPVLRWDGKVINIARRIGRQSIVSNDPAATVGNPVFDVLVELTHDSSLQARKYNGLEVNVLFGRR